MKKSTEGLKKELWKACRDLNPEKNCFTCGRQVEGSNRQLGHGVPSAAGGAILRYHPHNLHIQCYHCNINLGGNGMIYFANLEKEIGRKKIDKMLSLKNKTIKADEIFYTKMIELYKEGNEKKIIKYLESL